MEGEEINGKWSGRLESGWCKDVAMGYEEVCEVPPWHDPEDTLLNRIRLWLGI